MGNVRYTIIPLLICQLNPVLRKNIIIQHLKQPEVRSESNPEFAGEMQKTWRKNPESLDLFFLENTARWESLINTATQPDMLINSYEDKKH